MDSNPPASPPAPLSEVGLAVRYQSGQVYNRDLAGQGTLTFRGGEVVFEGRQRRTFFKGPATTLTFGPDLIRNVVTSGNKVEFRTTLGASGQKDVPFVFWCDSPEAAANAMALLPATTDATFLEAQTFAAKLQQLPGAVGVGSVTNWIIATNLLVFVIMGLLGAGWFETASMRPYVLYVANNGAATTAGEWWRLVTAMFVHYGLLHLALNMWALFQVGHLVEKLFGRPLFTLVYFASGITGSLATLLWHGDKVWSAGASGAVFGVYGALLGYLWREKQGVPKPVLQPLMKSTLTFAGYNLVFGAMHPQIDNVAHLGGVAGGVLFGWLSAMPLDLGVRERATAGRLLLGTGVLAAAVLVGIAAAPRYDYLVGDELRFEDAITARADQETRVLEAGQKLFQAAQNAHNEPQLIAWLRNESIPLYHDWRAELQSLPLQPGHGTTKRRDAMVQIFTMKIDSYRGLLAALERNDGVAGAEFGQQQQAINRAMEAFGKLPR